MKGLTVIHPGSRMFMYAHKTHSIDKKRKYVNESGSLISLAL